MSDSNDFDAEALDEILEIDQETYLEIIDCYITHTPELLDLLQHSIAQNDAPRVLQHAHKLKGSSLTMGLTTVSRIANELEESGRHGQTEAMPATLIALQTAVTDAYHWLHARKAKAKEP